jgi:hypothetical protein
MTADVTGRCMLLSAKLFEPDTGVSLSTWNGAKRPSFLYSVLCQRGLDTARQVLKIADRTG